ncbi:Nucleolin 1 [Cardamine amara subsp. amara]|uniref:Nucleolin 1 n=1 Tax=Cardamine amara subsp. amara TaxID=228776 RepID=A0ABD0ZW42_CARAN
MIFEGEDAKDKALAFDGTDVRGWIPIVKATLWQSYPFGSSVPRYEHCMMFVSGYDTGLAKIDIQIALCKHFSSCGEVTLVAVLPTSRASIMIEGERCEEKALHLNGSFMGAIGRNESCS